MNRYKYLLEAKKVAKVLKDMCKFDPEGNCYWETWHDKNHTLFCEPSTSLYSGNVGIALFFYELFRQTKDQNYIEIFTSNLKWIRKQEPRKPETGSLFYGSLGISFLLAKYYSTEGDQEILDEALDTALKLEVVLSKENLTNKNELLGGGAGTLYGLLYLYHFAPNEQLFELIKRCIEHILSDFHFYRKGIYWDREPFQVKGLCGMSHGISGIAQVLLEVGNYFNNETLKKIAALALNYENSFYDTKQNNWQDLRIGAYSEDYYQYYRESYLNNQNENFYKTNYMNAWCHGAPGIGLNRLRAYELTSVSKYKTDASRAIRKCFSESYLTHESLTLCHGLGGILDLYIEASRVLGSKRFLGLAETKFSDFIKYNTQNKYQAGFRGQKLLDASLFNGVAGIGYLCLRLYSPSTVPSILSPSMKESKNYPPHKRPLSYLNNAYFINKTIRRNFPKTLEAINTGNKNNWVLNTHSCKEQMDIKLLRSPTLETGLNVFKNHKKLSHVKKIFALEKRRLLQDSRIDNHFYFWIKYKANEEYLAKTPKNLIWDKTIKLEPSIYVTETASIAQKTHLRDELSIEKVGIILQSRWNGVEEIYPGKLAFLMIKALKQPMNVENHWNLVKIYMPSVSDDNFLKVAYLSQLNELIKHGIFLIV